MLQTKILVDTNSYLRLANNIHPLLFQEFGKEKYCLYVLDELDEEFNRNNRLKNKFHWVNEPEYKANRKRKLSVSKEEKQQITIVPDYIRDFASSKSLTISIIDSLVLAYGYVLKVPVVTDDADMICVAKEYKINIFQTLELLELMKRCGHIDMEKIKTITAYWEYNGDRPKNFYKDFKRLFNQPPPKF
ncbi:MAG: hypothetical protein ACD_79C00171G0004 [uncultured bacterium]|nr:MAG: hypothetical protein ACD_79C00171G0004 [uncultured bacterium]